MTDKRKEQIIELAQAVDDLANVIEQIIDGNGPAYSGDAFSVRRRMERLIEKLKEE